MTTGLPRDAEGEVITSASYGQHEVIVEVTYNTDFDGRVIDPEKEEHPRTLHGPFTPGEAQEWIEAYPDGDTDIDDMRVLVLNAVRPESTDFLRLFEAVAACEAPKGTQVDDVLGEFQTLYDQQKERQQ